MPRMVRCGLIQAQCEWSPEKYSLADIKKKMIAKHEHLIADAAKQKVQILGLQELFYGPYFCAEQQTRWYELTEKVPTGPTVTQMQKLAKKHQMVLVVPVYEVEMTGLYFNTAAVIDADGRYLGKYRKHHIPHCHPGFWEKFYFTPGNAGYPVFQTRYARVGVYICYDRHFPEGARILGLNGAEIVYNPSATVAVYGKSYFCDPRGKIVKQASRDKDELLVADLNLDEIQKVRDTWQFYRDRRPESYGEITRTRAAENSEAAN